MPITSGDTEVRLKYITVAAVQPELQRLIFNTGDALNWNTTDPDFLENDVPSIFENGDNVIFPGKPFSNIAVRSEPSGVVASNIYYLTNSNGTLMFLPDGSLTAENLFTFDRSNVAIQYVTDIIGIGRFPDNGELIIEAGGVYNNPVLYIRVVAE
jgi:hypothetical protein